MSMLVIEIVFLHISITHHTFLTFIQAQPILKNIIQPAVMLNVQYIYI